MRLRPGPVREQPTRVLNEKLCSRLTFPRPSGRPFAATRSAFDNNAVADGFQIYLHAFVLTADGDWAVVQQGMNEGSRLAVDDRRTRKRSQLSLFHD